MVLSHFVSFNIFCSPPKLTCVLLGSDRTWVLLALLGSDRTNEEGFAGVELLELSYAGVC